MASLAVWNWDWLWMFLCPPDHLLRGSCLMLQEFWYYSRCRPFFNQEMLWKPTMRKTSEVPNLVQKGTGVTVFFFILFSVRSNCGHGGVSSLWPKDRLLNTLHTHTNTCTNTKLKLKKWMQRKIEKLNKAIQSGHFLIWEFHPNDYQTRNPE